ncbi:MAG: phage adsorption protein NrfB [Verrucomicrobia subdivision 3 bacterium]|nr:phage adsorption protein NrfB [Limisphaerales bacterium]
MDIVENIFQILACITVVGFLISGLDDLFFDSQFLVYLLRQRKTPPVTLKQLQLAPEQWLAMFVPAWQEGGIVNKMAEYAARVLLYEKYDIFIGVYPNDPETIKCVDKICAVHPRVHKVVVPHPGPTSKADCLNWLYRAMRLNEVPGVREYTLIAIQDAEDVMHPLVLKVYNYFVPRLYDMGQIPVFALELPPLKYWTGNTYVDDFAELHTKDLFVRETMGGVVPSAGVGTVFSRPTVEALIARNGGDPFHIGNLTEDYEVGIRVKRAGLRAGMISVPIQRIVRRKRKDDTLGKPETITEVIAIRENFPNTFKAAVRQRSRWILGISFQTWEQTGWAGTLPMRYTLVRDRRAPLTHLINIIGYITLAYVLFQYAFQKTPWSAHLFIAPVFTADSILWKIAIIDTWLLAYRAIQKFISVYTIYNFKQACFSIPRVIVNNFINFTATMRATRTYLAHKWFGKPIVWVKTAHVFPGEAELAEYRKSIEDLLIEQGLATREQIFQALRKPGSAPLNLLRMGLLQEKQFTEIWARHSGLPVRHVSPYEVFQSFLQRFPEAQSVAIEALPVSQRHDKISVAFREPAGTDLLQRLAQQLGAPIEPFLALPSNIAYARDRAFPRLLLPVTRLAASTEMFRQAANLDSRSFVEALSLQHASHRSLPEVLVDLGALPEPRAREVWADALSCRPALPGSLHLHQEFYYKIGPSFWWLHRMMPIAPDAVVTATPPHPDMADWLQRKLGAQVTFVAELPGKLEAAARNAGVELDPEQVLLDCLVGKNVIRVEDAPNLQTMRSVVADPLPQWLLLHKRVSEEQLHQTFLEICYVPLAESWDAAEVARLLPILPPGFAENHGCYPLKVTRENITIGLTQLPPSRTLKDLHHRLFGYPLFFQALSFADSLKLRNIATAKARENL